MSAKIMKAIASGNCVIRNNRSGEIRIFWVQNGKMKFHDLQGHAKMDLKAHAPLECFRKSTSLRSLAYENHISLVEE